MKTKFFGGFPYKRAIVCHVISLENNPEKHTKTHKQKGENYSEFLKLVKQHDNNVVKCVDIIADGDLNATYVGDDATKKTAKEWEEQNYNKKQNRSVLDSFSQPNKHTLWHWKEIFDSKKYKDFYEKMKLDYANDGEFKKIVDKLAEEHKGKKSFEAARDYIIKECAGFLALPYVIREKFKEEFCDDKDTKIVFTYPSETFNAAVSYQMHKNKSELEYNGYNIKPPRLEPKNNQKKINNDPTIEDDHKITEANPFDVLSKMNSGNNGVTIYASCAGKYVFFSSNTFTINDLDCKDTAQNKALKSIMRGIEELGTKESEQKTANEVTTAYLKKNNPCVVL